PRECPAPCCPWRASPTPPPNKRLNEPAPAVDYTSLRFPAGCSRSVLYSAFHPRRKCLRQIQIQRQFRGGSSEPQNHPTRPRAAATDPRERHPISAVPHPCGKGATSPPPRW